MIIGGSVNHFNKVVTVGASSFQDNPGVAVTAGVSNAEGSWTAWHTLEDDCYGIYMLLCLSAGPSAVNRDALLDIGIDPAGGTSYTALISNIPCGRPQISRIGGYQTYWPIYIKAGTSIAVRIQETASTSSSFRVYGKVYCQPSNPELLTVGTYSETIGTITGSTGVTFTRRSTFNGSSWDTVGTTTRPLKYIQCPVQHSGTTATAAPFSLDIAYGDASNKTTVITKQKGGVSLSGYYVNNVLLPVTTYFCDIPAGSTLYARLESSATNTLFNGLVIGIG